VIIVSSYGKEKMAFKFEKLEIWQQSLDYFDADLSDIQQVAHARTL